MKLNTKSRYATTAMVELALNHNKQAVSIAELSQKHELPHAYLEQLFNQLKRAKLVQSQRGVNGGYILSRHPKEINLLDIICVIDKPVRLRRCQEHSLGCNKKGSRCLTHHLWESMDHILEDYLKKTTLWHVCANTLPNIVNLNEHNHDSM